MALAVTSLSAAMRLTKAGIGCTDMAACAQAVAVQAATPAATAEPAAMDTARLAHRVIASSVLALLLVMLVLCWRSGLRDEARAVLVLLGVTLFLAVLGRWSGGSPVPAVAIGNLLGGFVLFALSLRLAFVWRLVPLAPRWRRWAAAATLVLLAQVALGALVSATHAGLGCNDGADCGLSTVLGNADWQTLDPRREPALNHAVPGSTAGALANSLHRHGALLVLLMMLPLAWAAWRAGRAVSAVALLALLGTQIAGGRAAADFTLPLPLVLLHNASGAALLAVLVLLPGAPPARGYPRVAD